MSAIGQWQQQLFPVQFALLITVTPQDGHVDPHSTMEVLRPKHAHTGHFTLSGLGGKDPIALQLEDLGGLLKVSQGALTVFSFVFGGPEVNGGVPYTCE